ncbi:MAG: hypothetical protein ACI4TX_01185, partial [Christensenellales bacterium]
CGAKGSETFEVAKFNGEIESVSDISKVYDASAVSAPNVVTNSTGNVVIEYKLESEDDDAYTTTAPKNAGDYVVRVSIAENNDYTAVSTIKEFSISPIKLTGINLSGSYDNIQGNVRTVEIDKSRASNMISGEKVYIKVTFDSANAGASITSVEVFDDNDLTISCKNYTLSVDDINFTINKLNPALGFGASSGVSSSYSADKEYDGESVSIKYYVYSNEQSSSSVVVSWYNSDESQTKGDKLDSAPIDAGIYLVEIYLPATTNYRDASATKLVTISPKLLELNLTKEYDGLNTYSYELTVDDGLVAGDECTIMLTANSKNAGMYEMEDAPDYVFTNANYDILTKGGVYLTLEITKKKLTDFVVVAEYNSSKNYAVTLSTEQGIVDGDDVVINIQDSISTCTSSNGLRYQIVANPTLTTQVKFVSFTGTDAGNYEISYESGNYLEINTVA